MLSNLGVPSISKFAALAEAASDVRAFAVDHCQLVRGRDVVSIASLVTVAGMHNQDAGAAQGRGGSHSSGVACTCEQSGSARFEGAL